MQNCRRSNADMSYNKNKTKKFNPNKCLPRDFTNIQMTVESVDDILYEIGFNLNSNRDQSERPLFNYPLIIFAHGTPVSSFCFCQELVKLIV